MPNDWTGLLSYDDPSQRYDPTQRLNLVYWNIGDAIAWIDNPNEPDFELPMRWSYHFAEQPDNPDKVKRIEAAFEKLKAAMLSGKLTAKMLGPEDGDGNRKFVTMGEADWQHLKLPKRMHGPVAADLGHDTKVKAPRTPFNIVTSRDRIVSDNTTWTGISIPSANLRRVFPANAEPKSTPSELTSEPAPQQFRTPSDELIYNAVTAVLASQPNYQLVTAIRESAIMQRFWPEEQGERDKLVERIRKRVARNA